MSAAARRKASSSSSVPRAPEAGPRHQPDVDYGYLSDVQVQGSNAPSEVSNDFVVSTEILERHFKDKYKVLCDAYEQRIKDLASVIYETCERLITDSVVDEMKQDQASAAFIPSHVVEVIERQLISERERYIQDIVTKMGNMKMELIRSHEVIKAQTQKIGHMESELTKSHKSEILVESLQSKLEQLKGQLEDLTRRSEEDIRQLQIKNGDLEKKESDSRAQLQKLSIELNSKTSELDFAKKSNEAQQREIDRLTRSYDESNRTVAAMEESGIGGKQEKEELLMQLRKANDQNAALKQELTDLKVEMKFTADELRRTKEVLGAKAQEDDNSRQHVAALMAQIEKMLEEEESESNSCILAVQERMRKMKHKLTLEVQSERRISTTLRDELNQLSKDREEKARELKSLNADVLDLREKIGIEQMKVQSLQLSLQEQSEVTLDAKARAADAESRMKLAEDRLRDLEGMIPAQLQLVEDRAKLKAVEEAEQERSRLETKTSAYRLHYQNQLGELQNQVRHSFTFGDNSSYGHLPAAAGPAGGAGASVLSAEMSAIRAAQDNWNADRTRLENIHNVDLKTAEAKWQVDRTRLEAQHELALTRLEAKLQAEHREDISLLQRRLEEAGDNIARLKLMVLNGREGSQSLMNQLRARLQELEAENGQLKKRNADLDDTGNEMQKIIEEQEVTNREIKTTNEGLQASISQLRQTMEEREQANARLEASVNQLQRELIDCREQALKEQSQEAVALDEMKKKFDVLVKRYEEQLAGVPNDNASVSTLGSASQHSLEARATVIMHGHAPTTTRVDQSVVSHATQQSGFSEISHITQQSRPTITMQSPPSTTQGGSAAHFMSPVPIDPLAAAAALGDDASEHHERNRMSAQLSTIRTLEKNLRIKVELADSTMRELDFERERVVKHRKHAEKLYKLVASLEDTYKGSVRDLRRSLSVLRDVVEGVQSVVAIEVRRITRSLGIMAQQMFERIEAKKTEELEALKVSLARSHEKERELLERGYNIKISELVAEHGNEIERLRGQLDEALTSSKKSALETSALSLSAADTAAARAEFYSTLSADALSRHTAAMQVSTRHETETAPTNPTPVRDSVLKGVLDALTTSSVIPFEVAEEIIDLATQDSLPTLQALSTARSVIADHLATVAQGERRSSILSIGGSLRSNNGAPSGALFPISPARTPTGGMSIDGRGYPGGGYHGAGAVDPETGSVISDMRDGSINSRAFDVAVGELEQTRHEQAMLLDLARIEHEAQVKSLTARIEDLQRQHRLEIEHLRAEADESEAILRATLKNELESRCEEADEKVLEAEKNLVAEQERRQLLQAKLSELEVVHQRKVESLEEQIVELQQRAEKAEFEAEKLRMEAVHHHVS